MSRSVIIRDVVKKYGDFTAINKVSLNIQAGEFFTLLGPSGCGKTTLLRMIAGFNKIDDGEIYFDDKLINNIAPYKRDIGMVFQSYAIFPQMSVFENVAYGLKARKVPKDEIESRVMKVLQLVQIEKMKDRKPSELSGGQQQRVALSRAIVIEPEVLLMDEPLSNLDAKLRIQMRTSIRKIQQELKITTIYVTHDQQEALAVSDRIAILNGGNVMQVDKPENIYTKPQNSFVAGFIGTSNFIDGTVTDMDSDSTADVKLASGIVLKIKLNKKVSGPIKLSIRPEQFSFTDHGENLIPGEIVMHTFLGDFVNYEIRLTDGQLVQLNEYTKDITAIHESGSKVNLTFNANKISVFNTEGTEVLL
jgi:iron(III) transport system ATP-binding protein